MINITNKEDCCGCEACAQKCPQQCISMQTDNAGFHYPKVEIEQCIKCGICVRVCPVINQDEPHEPLQIYAAKHIDHVIRQESSSGGVFTVLAESVIEKGGVVFGARYDSTWRLVQDYATTKEELKDLRGSKYIQSKVGDSFQHTEKFLKQGRVVLYCGTPCYIAALKKYLNKEYQNLILVDFVCHGVPSPEIFKLYLTEVVTKLNIKEIKSISFRDKSRGWRNYSLSLSYTNQNNENKKLSESRYINSYLRGFTHNLFLRPSCSQCPAKSGKSGADLTLSDFWGMSQSNLSKIDDNKGFSLVYSFNNKVDMRNFTQLQIFDNIDIKPQLPFYKSTQVNKSATKMFFDSISAQNSFHYTINTMRPISYTSIAKSAVFNYLKSINNLIFLLCKERK